MYDRPCLKTTWNFIHSFTIKTLQQPHDMKQCSPSTCPKQTQITQYVAKLNTVLNMWFKKDYNTAYDGYKLTSIVQELTV